MRVLGLDAASTLGWCVGPDASAWGIWKLPEKVNNGRRLLEFSIWLNRMILEHKPDTLIIEAPLAGKSVAVTRILFGLFVIGQVLAAKHGIRFLEIYPSSLKKFFTGDGRAQKDDMIAECLRRGFKITNHNCADAFALVAYAVSVDL